MCLTNESQSYPPNTTGYVCQIKSSSTCYNNVTKSYEYGYWGLFFCPQVYFLNQTEEMHVQGKSKHAGFYGFLTLSDARRFYDSYSKLSGPKLNIVILKCQFDEIISVGSVDGLSVLRAKYRTLLCEEGV